MFVLRVKHLLLACSLSILFLYYTSSPQIDFQNDAQFAKRMRNAHEEDQIDKFIDRYIKESDEKFETSETTEETVLYLYNGDEKGGDGELENSDVDDDDEENDNDYEDDDDEYDQDDDGDADDDDDYANKDDDGDSDQGNDDVESIGDEVKTSLNEVNNIQQEENDARFPGESHNKVTKNNKLSQGELSRKENSINLKKPNISKPSNFNRTTPRNQQSSGKLNNGKILASKAKSESIVKAEKAQLPLGPSMNEERRTQIHQVSPIVVLPKDKYWPPVLQPSDAHIFEEINYTKYSQEDRAYLLGRKGIYEERARTVSEVCRNNPNLIAPTPIHNFVWDRNHEPNIVWCEIPKAASTSWMVNFLRLGHYRENDTTLGHLTPEERDAIRFETRLKDDNLHFRVLRLFPAPNTTLERREVFSNALRFIIVRHPFTRLLSGYTDKMTTLTPLPRIYKFRELQTAIIERYRGNKSLPKDFDPQFPTFAEFVQYVIDSTANLKTLKEWKKVTCWQPYWTKCGVCAHDFQMIMKLETMVEDERFLIKLASLQELDKVYEWRHEKKNSQSKDDYFKQLSTEQMQLLHQRFLLDFQLFGYSIHEYLTLAYDSPEQNILN